MSCLAYERIRVRLAWNPDSKLGFIVYRCTYTSDDDWRRFMEFLDKTVHQSLVDAELGDVLDRLEWNVQEDVSLEEASFDTVRRKFQEWNKSGAEPNNLEFSRRHACIMVNKSILDRTLEYIAKHPDGKFDLWGFARVYLVSAKDGGPNDDICGGPFGNPYTDPISEIPDSKLLKGHVEDEFEWLSSSDARLFGVPPSLEYFRYAKPTLDPNFHAYTSSSELLSFFGGDVYRSYASDALSFMVNGQNYRAHWPIIMAIYFLPCIEHVPWSSALI
ncbi:hypothetical protein B5807_02545 [Epicoccum nigrum]|uniref:Uncharacterized protein n=1 Tax=Epicoccum nigrum TaxID=105696 RepID=A0A1Y2MAT7_EPING|nr:hypothetical protein B5807_02545 [Epicoccum nigrum]